jgi:16S rRNA (cytidine1402-2'-O)-methyltransferase
MCDPDDPIQSAEQLSELIEGRVCLRPNPALLNQLHRRELTKRFETFLFGTARELAGRLETDDEQRLGELVILVEGWQDPGGADQAEQERVLRILAADLPLRQAAGLTARLTGGRKNDLYRMGLDLGLGAGERDP